MESPLLSQGTIGKYELLAKISQGGMGEVFLGRQQGAQGFSRLVAVKVILPEVASVPEARSAFFDEAQLSARLAHPGIAQVIDFGESGGALYLVMEFVAGVSFSFIGRRQPGLLAPVQIARLMAQVCRALHAAHEAHDETGRPLKVVHRDISPQNLLLTFGGTVKIIDFGIAKMLERRGPDTHHGLLKGKPRYVAPEQISLGDSDRRSDLWACAVVTYEMLTGKGLFNAPTDWATLNAVMTRDVPLCSTIAGPLPAGFDALLARGLRKDPAERFATGLELAAALDAISIKGQAPPLETVVAAALAEEKVRHQAWLAGLAEQPRSAAVQATPSKVDQELSRETKPMRPPLEPVAPRRRRWALGSSAALGAVAVAAGVWWFAQLQPVAVIDPPTPVPVPAPAAIERLPEQALAPNEPVKEVPAPRPVGAKHVLRPRPAPQPAAAVAGPVVGSGTVTIGAGGSYALVRVDGAMLGPTPVIDHPLNEGTHLIEWLAPDTNQVRERRNVTIAAGKHAQVTIP